MEHEGSQPPPARSARRTFRALHIPDYRIFWSGQLLSQTGMWVHEVAQSWLVLSLTDSPLALGTLMTVRFTPMLLLSLFGGVIADRTPKRRLLMVTQTVMLAQVLLMALLTTTGLITMAAIYVLSAVRGITEAVDIPTRQSFVYELVGTEDLPNAVALNSTQFNLARIVGPAVGGALVATVGYAPCFYINAATILALIVGYALIRPERLTAAARAAEGTVLKQVGEGLRYALTTPDVALVLMLMLALGTFGYNFPVVLPLFARYALGSGAAGLGTLMAAMGIGSLLGALALAYRGRATRRGLFLGAGGFTGLLLLLSLAPTGGVAVPVLVLLGFMGMTFMTTASTRLQLITPGPLRGRVMSMYTLLFIGTTPVGSLVIGFMAERVGIRPTIAVMAAFCAVGVVAGVLYRRSAVAKGGFVSRADGH